MASQVTCCHVSNIFTIVTQVLPLIFRIQNAEFIPAKWNALLELLWIIIVIVMGNVALSVDLNHKYDVRLSYRSFTSLFTFLILAVIYCVSPPLEKQTM